MREINSRAAKRTSRNIPVWIKPGIWGALFGALAIAIIGFLQLGWTTLVTAEKLAQELPTGSRCRTRPHLRGDGSSKTR